MVHTPNRYKPVTNKHENATYLDKINANSYTPTHQLPLQKAEIPSYCLNTQRYVSSNKLH